MEEECSAKFVQKLKTILQINYQALVKVIDKTKVNKWLEIRKLDIDDKTIKSSPTDYLVNLTESGRVHAINLMQRAYLEKTDLA